jgi:hypothetical protein
MERLIRLPGSLHASSAKPLNGFRYSFICEFYTRTSQTYLILAVSVHYTWADFYQISKNLPYIQNDQKLKKVADGRIWCAHKDVLHGKCTQNSLYGHHDDDDSSN